MKLRLATPEVLIDIGAIEDLSYIQDKGDIAIGALTKHGQVEQSDILKEPPPLLAHTASHVGDPQVRNRGTIGDPYVTVILFLISQLRFATRAGHFGPQGKKVNRCFLH